MFPYQKIIATPIIFNNTGYLILMLGAVGCSPVVSPHRIKQACQPYQVVKVATECGLLARSTNEVWCRGKTVMIPLYFRLCYVFSCSAILSIAKSKSQIYSVHRSYVRTQTEVYALT